MKLLFLIIAASFIATGCSTTLNKNQDNGSLDVSVSSHLRADIDVDMSKQVKGTARHKKLLWFITVKDNGHYVDGVNYAGGDSGWKFFGPGMVEETKSAAAYQAVVPNKVDVLVAPQYVVKVKSYFFGVWKEVTASVTGYAGKIRDIKMSSKKHK